MADFIEARLDVAFENPPCAMFVSETTETLRQRIGAASAFSKSVGVRGGARLGYRRQRQRIQPLHGAVAHGRYPQWSKFAGFLANVDTA
jgi:hypothetical protein